MKKAFSSIKKPVLYLIGAYCAIVLCRFLLALFTSAYPMVNIDEYLYYGMARSISEGKGLMFRGQPANYSYILYSLVLSPVYFLGFHGVVLFRALQLWNILISSVSVFPLFYIARRVQSDDRHAFLTSLACMLLPDFMLGQTMMCENIIFPLFFSLFALILSYLYEAKFSKIIGIGIIGGLLFSAKPGEIIPAAVFEIVLFVLAIHTKRKTPAFHAIISILISAAIASCFFGIVSLFKGNASLLSIYQSQVADGKHLNVFFKFIGIYILYFILAGGIGFFAVSFHNWKVYSFEQKTLFCTIMISLVFTIVGIAWTVNRYEYNANTAHMRYIGMYIPLIYLFAIIPFEQAKKRRAEPVQQKNLAVWSILFLTAVLLILGIYAGVNHYSTFVENTAFAIIIQSFRNSIPAFIVSAIVVVFVALWFWILLHPGKTVTVAVTVVLLICMLINNIAAYAIVTKDTRFAFAKQTEQLMQHIDPNDELLYLYTVETTTSYYGALDVYSRKGISYVHMNDMFNQLYSSKGKYLPFVPEGQRGNTPTLMTPNTNTLVMDPTVFYMLKLAENNTTHFTENEEGLHLVKISDLSKPWLDAVIGNTSNTILSAGETGILLIFNDAYLQSPCTVKLTVKCDQPTTLRFFSSAETKNVSLEEGMHNYEIVFEHPMNAYNFVAESGDIRLYGFDLTN